MRESKVYFRTQKRNKYAENKLKINEKNSVAWKLKFWIELIIFTLWNGRFRTITTHTPFHFHCVVVEANELRSLLPFAMQNEAQHKDSTELFFIVVEHSMPKQVQIQKQTNLILLM